MTKLELAMALFSGHVINRLETCGKIYTNVYVSGVELESGSVPRQHFNVSIYRNGSKHIKETVYVKTID